MTSFGSKHVPKDTACLIDNDDRKGKLKVLLDNLSQIIESIGH